LKRGITKGDIPVLILAALAAQPSHGYAIARRIEEQTGGVLQMKEGTLYPALRKMEADGLIAGGWEVQPSGPAKKVYKITETGRTQLAEHRSEWEQFSRLMSIVLGGDADVQPA
jgi:PadR family transcriptional regulator, regulatory protein PadR